MRVLWTSNVLFEEVCQDLKLSIGVGGSWMHALADLIKDDIQLGVVCIKTGYNYNKIISGIHFYVIDSLTELSWNSIVSEFGPDIIHIHGTEYEFTNDVFTYSKNIPCVISIQGMASECARFFNGGISLKELSRYITPKCFFCRTRVADIQKILYKKGESEISLLKKAHHVIGRTEWDRCNVLSLNPRINYYVCNEVLRDSFYRGTWSYEQCNKHSIFITGSMVALKGAHQVVKAMAIVKERYPDLKAIFIGRDITGQLSFKKYIMMSDYNMYLRHLIKQYGLENNIEFKDHLSEIEMKEYFLSCNVCVLPSSVENSSNSLSEAQMLGVPVLASYTGGTPTLMKGILQDNLYRFEDYQVLARKIEEIFERKYWDQYVESVRKIALERHDKQTIKESLLDIYKKIVVS
ncbi:MAG: glycosyltransferase [Bacteroidales bacterium]|jgi:glycosyltransferase involved in cell wall biosynthesis|nr:glycosyltransferase [Bacteroidales bacterium]